MKTNFFFLLPISLLFFLSGGCYKVSDKIEPKVSYSVQTSYLKSLHSCFPPLSEEEKNTNWGKEFLIAKYFAKDLDFYRAITDFKRAEILLENAKYFDRKLEIEYNILLCYFLGKKYEEVINQFETSDLKNVSSSFLAFHDLLVILYDSYHQLKEEKKADEILGLMGELYPATKTKLDLSKALSSADFSQVQPKTLKKETLKEEPLKGDALKEKLLKEKNLKKETFKGDFLKEETLSCEKQEISTFVSEYQKTKKSVARAQLLNLVMPGAGYLYVGQKKSAITAFLVNGLFIAAAYQFFHKGYVAAGVVTTSFEMGWYFGGIYGAGEAAKFYNEQLYEKNITPIMNNKGYFPIFSLDYAF
jgi:tetratricopeptide (TPR) repeat protein